MRRNEGPTVFDNSDFAIGKDFFPKESKTRQTVFFRLSLKSKFLTKEKKEKREKQSEKKGLKDNRNEARKKIGNL